MAKSNRSRKIPQPRHPKKGKLSRHDRRERLRTPNPNRQPTEFARFPIVGGLAAMVTTMTMLLHPKMAFRFSILFSGMFVAKGRRTVSSWLRGAGVKDDWDCFYDSLVHFGKATNALMLPLLRLILDRFASMPNQTLRLVIDDSPTRRFGKHIEGANVHHNPTPGPADSEWLFGHCWVTIAAVVKHQFWGSIALPILAKLYVRQVDVPKLPSKHKWEFQTKIQLAIALVKQVTLNSRFHGSQATIELVVDGAYACRELLKQMFELGITVFSRLRSDACLFDLPPTRKSGQRGRPRKYGKNKINLAKRAKDKRGWDEIEILCRGKLVTRRVKTFLATSKLAVSSIRVVLVSFENGNWAAYFCTDPTKDVKTIMEAISDRWAIEEFFHDVKEVWKSGEQQVRNIWSNIACWNMNQWAYTLTELESWDAESTALVDRRTSPWDNQDRRPSHADLVRAIRAKMLAERFSVELQLSQDDPKMKRLIDELLVLAA
jgi:hypothetical protein